MALVPRGREVFDTDSRFVERLHLGPGVSVGESDVGIECVDSLRVGDAELGKTRGTIAAELSEIHVERAVFLKHEEDVLDHAGGYGAYSNGRRLRDGSAVTGGRGCGVSGGGGGSDGRASLLRRARTAHRVVGSIDQRECSCGACGDLPGERGALSGRDGAGRRRETESKWNCDGDSLWTCSAARTCGAKRIRCRRTHRYSGRARSGEWTGIICDREGRTDRDRRGVGGCPGERGGLSGAYFSWHRGELRNLWGRVGRDLDCRGLRRAGATWSGSNSGIGCRLCWRVLCAAGSLRAADDRSSGGTGRRGDGHGGGIKRLPVQRDTLAAADRSCARREGDSWGDLL